MSGTRVTTCPHLEGDPGIHRRHAGGRLLAAAARFHGHRPLLALGGRPVGAKVPRLDPEVTITSAPNDSSRSTSASSTLWLSGCWSPTASL